MRILITGGRDFNDAELLHSTLDRIHAATPITVLIHGAARGVDRRAAEWALENDVEVIACSADWRQHGRGAGLVANKLMLDHNPDLVVAFPGGKGTSHMVALAQKAGICVVFAEEPDAE